jgi:alkylation response protein AidB-like acyl-CoA dehydrogenase
MDFSLTEEERMVVQMADRFAQGELRPQMRVHEAAGALPASVRDSFEQTGIPMLGVAEVDPDLPVSWPARCRAIQKLAQADGAATLQLWRSAWLPPAAAQLGSSGAAHAMVLVRDRAELSWPIPCLPVGGGNRLLVLDDAGSWGIAHVSTTEVRALGLAAAGPAQCTLIEWVEQGQASPSAAAAARGAARLWGATILTGIAQASLAYASAYVQERVSFGKPLSNHQAVAFMVAEMAMRVEGMDAICIHAAWMAESKELGPCNDAWLECIEAALWVTDQGVQLLGGHGYTRDHPVEKWMREARALSLLWGGIDLAMDEAARGEG